MLRAALAFFILGLVAVMLGANNIAGLSLEIGKALLFVFLALAVISAIVGLVSGRGSRGGSALAFAAALLMGGAASLPTALADENVGDKIENKYDEVKKDSKKAARKAKRKTRNATGQGSVVEDTKDAAKDTGGEISHGAEKLKNKVD
jgi:uncharacterized membrane protein YtjA (UPF0391 family)